MKLTIVHGQGHRGVTYTMTKEILGHLAGPQDDIREFFLPKDGPDFCCGCNSCFLKGEEHCPGAEKVQPIAAAIEQADIVILDSPNYVMEMSGSLKSLMDHLAYRWVTHRPHGAMFTKVGIVVCSSAGAPPGGVTRSMAGQLKWMGFSKVYRFGLVSGAMGPQNLSEKKRRAIRQRAVKIARAAARRAAHPRPGLRGYVTFFIFRKMQGAPAAAWNPTDRDWWMNQGWTKKVRPWKK